MVADQLLMQLLFRGLAPVSTIENANKRSPERPVFIAVIDMLNVDKPLSVLKAPLSNHIL